MGEKVSLREHLEALIALERDHQKQLRSDDRENTRLALAAVEKRRDEDTANYNHRFEENNDAKATAARKEGTFLTKDQFDQYQRNQTGDRFNGRTDIRGTVTMIAALGAIALTIILNLIR